TSLESIAHRVAAGPRRPPNRHQPPRRAPRVRKRARRATATVCDARGESMMKITRRQFNQATLGLGLAWTGGRLITGCSEGDSHSTAPPSVPTETKTFHFDLSTLPLDDAHVLRAGGRRYPLQRHTDATRSAARAEKLRLRRVPDEHLTHFVEGVEVSAVGQQRIHVTTFNAQRGHGLALVAMHIPTDARRRARSAP